MYIYICIFIRTTATIHATYIKGVLVKSCLLIYCINDAVDGDSDEGDSVYIVLLILNI